MLIIKKKRNNKKTPITTKVDECINAEAGVGASIASGNQTNKRNCAHLQKAAPIKHINNKLDTVISNGTNKQ